MVKPSMEKQSAERNSTTSYRGVRKRKWGKYVSEIRLPNSRQRIWLGSYDSAEKAARAFDAAMFCLRGSGARFNFPADPPDIAGGRTMTPSQIQIAAARFANSEPPKECSRQRMECLTSDEESHETTSSLPLDMSSPPLSDVTIQNDSGYVPDLFSDLGSGNFQADFSVFPGFDDFSNDFLFPEIPSSFDYGEENFDGLMIQDSFLWNF